MKALVFVLVLVNALFFAYTQGYFGRPENPDAGRVDSQVNPDRVRVTARGEPPAAKGGTKKEAEPAAKEAVATEQEAPPADKEAGAEKPAPAAKAAAAEKPAAPVPESCWRWSELTGPEANRLAALLEEKFSDFRLERRATPAEGAGWWVFIPPLPSKAEAEKKAAELKRMGVGEYFIVQEPGPNRYAISLGVFSNEAGAGEQLAGLRAKGVRSAKMGQRIGKDALQTVEARGPAARQAALTAAAAAALPGIVFQKCK